MCKKESFTGSQRQLNNWIANHCKQSWLPKIFPQKKADCNIFIRHMENRKGTALQRALGKFRLERVFSATWPFQQFMFCFPSFLLHFNYTMRKLISYQASISFSIFYCPSVVKNTINNSKIKSESQIRLWCTKRTKEHSSLGQPI